MIRFMNFFIGVAWGIVAMIGLIAGANVLSNAREESETALVEVVEKDLTEISTVLPSLESALEQIAIESRRLDLNLRNPPTQRSKRFHVFEQPVSAWEKLFREHLHRSSLEIQQLEVDENANLVVHFTNGTLSQLGSHDLVDRFKKVVIAYELIADEVKPSLIFIDARYDQGVALRFNGIERPNNV